MGGCQNYGPFWGTLNIRCRIIIKTQKGTLILRTTHMRIEGCRVPRKPEALTLDSYWEPKQGTEAWAPNGKL